MSPEPPSSSPARAIDAEAGSACLGSGQPLDLRIASYGVAGSPLCPDCAAAEALQAQQARALDSLVEEARSRGRRSFVASARDFAIAKDRMLLADPYASPAEKHAARARQWRRTWASAATVLLLLALLVALRFYDQR